MSRNVNECNECHECHEMLTNVTNVTNVMMVMNVNECTRMYQPIITNDLCAYVTNNPTMRFNCVLVYFSWSVVCICHFAYRYAMCIIVLV